VERDRAGGDPALGGDVLVERPELTSWAICSSIAVSLTIVDGLRLRAVSLEARSSCAARGQARLLHTWPFDRGDGGGTA
jgi:hypothetical protein